MITLKEFMEVVEYRITEGSDYTWDCFGPKPYSLSAWNGDQSGWSFNITFDTETQDVYSVEACDYKNNRAYRLINPDWIDNYNDYADRFNPEYKNQAWDDTDFVDLETKEDWLEKARAIISGEDYDTRVSVPVDFTDEELLTYMKMAHDRDMTFNEFVEMALREVIEKNLRDELDEIRLEYDFANAESGNILDSIEKIKKKKKGKK
jgi:hypothetical protein